MNRQVPYTTLDFITIERSRRIQALLPRIQRAGHLLLRDEYDYGATPPYRIAPTEHLCGAEFQEQ